jgi:hypothetical protein
VESEQQGRQTSPSLVVHQNLLPGEINKNILVQFPFSIGNFPHNLIILSIISEKIILEEKEI